MILSLKSQREFNFLHKSEYVLFVMDADGAAPIPSPSLTVTDGVRSDHVADSPTSSNGAQSTTRSKHVPIARQKTGYERPERARTSHACEPCRERKTKCDGERPACRRCVHTGTNCHYGYGKGWKKRKYGSRLEKGALRITTNVDKDRRRSDNYVSEARTVRGLVERDISASNARGTHDD